ncbi:MAG TPA: class I SAM-dependent methyltransferase [Candidatus Nitrosocosmicus sp.]|nr:class I SAM-dependent methyltransferase [Candidatus Nitrosocosmicus sp.]
MTHPKYKDFNQKQYQENVSIYLENNNDGYVGGNYPSDRVKFLSTILPTERHILEIGSGPGHDALALQEFGYHVTASDYVDAFVKILKNKKLKTIKFNAKEDHLNENYDAIYANAVLVHFSANEINDFLIRVKNHLRNEKVVFISFKKGKGSERTGSVSGIERDFNYHTLDEIKELANSSGYEIVKINEVDEKWMQILLQIQ